MWNGHFGWAFPIKNRPELAIPNRIKMIHVNDDVIILWLSDVICGNKIMGVF